MTIPPTSPAPAEPQGGTGDLGWLLENFLVEVPGADAAVLASRDGLPLASAGLTAAQPDQLAAVSSSLHSSGRIAGDLTDPPGGDVQLLMVHLDHKYLFVMSTQPGDGAAAGASVVGTLLAVLAAHGADTRMIGREMKGLVTSVARHLGTTARTGSMAGASGDTRSGDDEG
jgi:predicted regulator of Ras-like GTPase activity (Roadblock/LC7/MglB family)